MTLSNIYAPFEKSFQKDAETCEYMNWAKKPLLRGNWRICLFKML